MTLLITLQALGSKPGYAPLPDRLACPQETDSASAGSARGQRTRWWRSAPRQVGPHSGQTGRWRRPLHADLFADRTSSTKWWANQYRLLLAGLACLLLETMRRTTPARSTATTRRAKTTTGIGLGVLRGSDSVTIVIDGARREGVVPLDLLAAAGDEGPGSVGTLVPPGASPDPGDQARRAALKGIDPAPLVKRSRGHGEKSGHPSRRRSLFPRRRGRKELGEFPIRARRRIEKRGEGFMEIGVEPEHDTVEQGVFRRLPPRGRRPRP